MKRATVIPTIRYRDAPAAIDWLCGALGFTRQLVVPGEQEGTITHAQLRFAEREGDLGMVMVGSRRDDLFSEAGPSSIFVIVDDVDGHCAKARAAGAKICMEPEDQGYGGRLYSCRDLEDNIWSFGSYDPWAAPDQV